MAFQERYSPIVIGVNATYTGPEGNPTAIAGFIAATSGTITVTNFKGQTVIATTPVTAGVYLPMPFYAHAGFVVVLAGGASGTLAAW